MHLNGEGGREERERGREGGRMERGSDGGMEGGREEGMEGESKTARRETQFLNFDRHNIIHMYICITSAPGNGKLAFVRLLQQMGQHINFHCKDSIW